MGGGVSVPIGDENSKNVYESLQNKFAALKSRDEDGKLPEKLPETLEECAEYSLDAEADAAVVDAYGILTNVYQDKMAEFEVTEIIAEIKTLPDAIDAAVFQHEQWPVIIDPSGQAARFLKYQRGTFVSMDNPLDTVPDFLRKSLVGSLQYGTSLVFNFEESDKIDFAKHFSPENLPPQILQSKAVLFAEETWTPLLRPDQGDPSPDLFRPVDDFKMVVLTKHPEAAEAFAKEHNFALIKVKDPTEHAKSSKGDAAVNDALAAAFGARDVKRNSTKMVESAFDGDWDAIQNYLDQGYSYESEDAHGHTLISEAACQGHKEVIEKLLDLGADPNSQNDTGRTPLYRASYNGHEDVVRLLLERGGDPRLRSNMESPFDVAKTESIGKILEEWDIEETERLLTKRREEEEKRIESRLSTAAERDAYARDKIRQELIQLATDGNVQGLKERFQEIADEAMQHNERPRGTAEVRDERGNTLLLIAVWKNHLPLVEMLLTTYAEFDPEFDVYERKVFFSNIKARDAKGWNACALATFHGHKAVLQYLLDHEGDPYVKNCYNKNSFDLAQDELDAARAVVVDRSEIRNVLLDWEVHNNPRVAAQRDLDQKAKEMAIPVEEEISVQQELQNDKPAKKKAAGGAKGGKVGSKPGVKATGKKAPVKKGK